MVAQVDVAGLGWVGEVVEGFVMESRHYLVWLGRAGSGTEVLVMGSMVN